MSSGFELLAVAAASISFGWLVLYLVFGGRAGRRSSDGDGIPATFIKTLLSWWQ